MNRRELVHAGNGDRRAMLDSVAVDQDWDEIVGEDGSELAIDLRAIWGAIYRSRWLILGIMVAAVLAGMGVTLLTPPTYRARASIQVDQRSARLLKTDDDDDLGSSLADSDRFLQTQVDILHSRTLAARVAKSLRLEQSKAFFAAVSIKLRPEQTKQDLHVAVLDALQDHLKVDLPRNSRVIGISFDSRDPRLSAAIASQFSTEFIASSLQRRFDQSSYAREFLQNQLGLTKARLEQSEVALIAYARSARLIDASAGAPTTNGQVAGPRSLTTSNLVEANQAYSTSRSDRIEAEQRWQQAQNTPLLNLPEVLTNSSVQELTQKRAELQAQYQQERARHKPDYPSVQEAAAALAELDRQINAIATSIRDSIHDKYLVAKRQEEASKSEVGQLAGETLSEQDRSVRYNILKREADTNRELYDGLLQRYKEVSAEAGATNNNIEVIDRAEVPSKPVSPRPTLNLALALLAGAALAALLTFARERFGDAIRSPDEVEGKLGLPLMGTVPLVTGRQTPKEALADLRSALSEAFYAIRTSLELSSGEGVPRTLLLTSSRSGEGKSTTAYAIALNFAAAGRRVLLIDADLRNPSLDRMLRLPNRIGFSNLLAQQADMAAAIQHSGTDNLDFMPSGPLPPSAAQLLGSETLGKVLHALAADYDLIILDGPPVLGLADSPLLATAAQGTLFVVEANRAHRGAAKAAIRRLASLRVRLLGVILTKFDAKKAGYGGYDSYYSFRYGSTDDREQIAGPAARLEGGRA